MLRFHHFLKESAEFQRLCHKDLWQFPPGSAWIVFTDTASHACLSGQYALEQTLIIRHESLVLPGEGADLDSRGVGGLSLEIGHCPARPEPAWPCCFVIHAAEPVMLMHNP